MNNRIQILADVVVNDAQVDQAIKKGTDHSEAGKVAARDIAANQVRNEVDELSRLLSVIQNNEKPGYYKKLDEEGQKRVAALQSQLAEMRGAGREELHAVAKEVGELSQSLGVRASKALSSQISTIGDMVVSIDDVRLDSAALMRARAKGIKGMSGMEATVRMRVDNAELKVARAEMEELDRQARAAVRRSESRKAQVRRLSSDEIVTTERGAPMRGRGILTHGEALARTNDDAVATARAVVLERGKSVLEGKDLSAEQVRTRAAALIKEERKTGQSRYSGEQKRILLGAAENRPYDARDRESRQQRFTAAAGVQGDFTWPEAYQPATRVIAARNLEQAREQHYRDRVAPAVANIAARANKAQADARAQREQVRIESLEPHKRPVRVDYREVNTDEPLRFDQAPKGSRFSPAFWGVDYTYHEEGNRPQAATLSNRAKTKMAFDAAKVAVTNPGANHLQYQAGLGGMQVLQWRPQRRAQAAEFLLNPSKVAQVMLSGQDPLKNRSDVDGAKAFGEDMRNALGLTAGFGEKSADYGVRAGSDLERLLEQNEKRVSVKRGSNGAFTLRNRGGTFNPHDIDKLFQRARGFTGDVEKGQALTLDGQRVGVADLYRMMYGGQRGSTFVAGGLSAYDLYPTMSYGESQAALEEAHLHGRADVADTTRDLAAMRVFETDPDVAESRRDARDGAKRTEHATNQLLGLRYQYGQRIDARLGQQSVQTVRETLLDVPQTAEQRRNYVLGSDMRQAVRSDLRGLTYFDDLLTHTLNPENVRAEVEMREQRQVKTKAGHSMSARDAAHHLRTNPKAFTRSVRRELAETENLRRYAASGVITDGVRSAFAAKLERELFTDALPEQLRADGTQTSELANLPVPAAAAGQLAERRREFLDPATYGALRQYAQTGVADARATSYLATWKKEHRDNLMGVDLAGPLELDDTMAPILRPTINSVGDMLEAAELYADEHGLRAPVANPKAAEGRAELDRRAEVIAEAQQSLIPEMVAEHQQKLSTVFRATEAARNAKGELMQTAAANVADGDQDLQAVQQTTVREYLNTNIAQYEAASEIPKLYGLNDKATRDLMPDAVLKSAYASTGTQYLEAARLHKPQMARYVAAAQRWQAAGMRVTSLDTEALLDHDATPEAIAAFLERESTTVANATGQKTPSHEVAKSSEDAARDRALAQAIRGGGSEGPETGDIGNLLLDMPVNEGIDPDEAKHWDGGERESAVSRHSREVEQTHGKDASRVFERYVTRGSGAGTLNAPRVARPKRDREQVQALYDRLSTRGPADPSEKGVKRHAETLAGLAQALRFTAPEAVGGRQFEYSLFDPSAPESWQARAERLGLKDMTPEQARAAVYADAGVVPSGDKWATEGYATWAKTKNDAGNVNSAMAKASARRDANTEQTVAHLTPAPAPYDKSYDVPLAPAPVREDRSATYARITAENKPYYSQAYDVPLPPEQAARVPAFDPQSELSVQARTPAEAPTQAELDAKAERQAKIQAEIDADNERARQAWLDSQFTLADQQRAEKEARAQGKTPKNREQTRKQKKASRRSEADRKKAGKKVGQKRFITIPGAGNTAMAAELPPVPPTLDTVWDEPQARRPEEVAAFIAANGLNKPGMSAEEKRAAIAAAAALFKKAPTQQDLDDDDLESVIKAREAEGEMSDAERAAKIAVMQGVTDRARSGGYGQGTLGDLIKGKQPLPDGILGKNFDLNSVLDEAAVQDALISEVNKLLPEHLQVTPSSSKRAPNATTYNAGRWAKNSGLGKPSNAGTVPFDPHATPAPPNASFTPGPQGPGVFGPQQPNIPMNSGPQGPGNIPMGPYTGPVVPPVFGPQLPPHTTPIHPGNIPLGPSNPVPPSGTNVFGIAGNTGYAPSALIGKLDPGTPASRKAAKAAAAKAKQQADEDAAQDKKDLDAQLYTPVNASIYRNAWTNGDTFDNAKPQDYNKWLQDKFNEELVRDENRKAIRAADVGRVLKAQLEGEDYYQAKMNGLPTSAWAYTNTETEAFGRQREAAATRGAAAMGLSLEDFRKVGAGGFSPEQAMTKLLGGKLSDNMINNDEIMKIVADYSKQLMLAPQEGTRLVEEARKKIKAETLKLMADSEDVVGKTQDQIRVEREAKGLNESSADKRAYDGQNRTAAISWERQMLAGTLRVTPAELQDASRGPSLEHLIQSASGLNIGQINALSDEAIAKFGVMAAEGQQIAINNGVDSPEMQSWNDSRIERRQEILSDADAAAARTTEQQDRARRYKDRIDREIGGADSQARITANQNAGMTRDEAIAAERRRVADRMAVVDERKGMFKAGLVNMGAFLGGSLLEQGLTYGVQQLQDGMTAQAGLKRAVDVQGAMLGENDAKPAWWPVATAEEARYSNGMKLVRDYSSELGGTQTETANLVTELSSGGDRSQNEVRESLEALSRAAQNTGMKLSDLTAGMEALGAINFDPDEAAEFLGKYAGLKGMNVENIAEAAQKISTNTDAKLLSDRDREALLIGTSKAGGAFTAFSGNAYTAAKQTERLIESGRKAQGKEAPKLDTAGNPLQAVGKWAAGLVNVQQLLKRINTLITQLAKALAPVIGVWMGLVGVVLDIVNAVLTAGNSFGWISSVTGAIVGLTTVVLALNSALKALHFPNMLPAIGRFVGATTLGTAATARWAAASAAAGTAVSTAAAGGTVATLGVARALQIAAVGARTFVTALLGPVGLIIAGLTIAGTVALGFFNKAKASEEAKRKNAEDVQRLGNTAKNLPNYTPGGAFDSQGKLDVLNNGGRENRAARAVQVARASLGDFEAGLGLDGDTAEAVNTRLAGVKQNGSEADQRFVDEVFEAKKRISGARLAIDAADVAGTEAYNASLVGSYRGRIGSLGALGYALSASTTGTVTDEQFEADAFRAKREARKRDLTKSLRDQGVYNIESLAQSAPAEYAKIKLADLADAKQQVELDLKALDTRKQLRDQTAKMNDDQLVQLEGSRTANQLAQNELAILIAKEKVESVSTGTTGNMNTLQERMNALILERKKLEQDILNTRLEQIAATERFLELEGQLGLKESPGLTLDLAGQEAGTVAERGSATPVTDVINSVITALKDPAGPHYGQSSTLKDIAELTELTALSRPIDALKNQQRQELETAKLAYDDPASGVTAAQYESNVAAINDKYKGLIDTALAALTKSVANSPSLQRLMDGSVAATSNQLGNLGVQSQGYGATAFAKAQKDSGAWKGTGSAYEKGLHDGRDFAVPIGTDLKTSVGGTLRFIKDDGVSGWGSRSQVTTADGRTLTWAHQDTKLMEQFMKDMGYRYNQTVQVNAGEKIGVSGNSTNPGVKMGAHVHVKATAADGSDIDPLELLKGQVSGNNLVGGQTFAQRIAAAVATPALSSSTGVQAARGAAAAVYDEGATAAANRAQQAAAVRALESANAADRDGVGAPDGWAQARARIDNGLARSLAEISRAKADALATLQREYDDPTTSVARKAEIKSEMEVTSRKAQEERRTTLTSARATVFSNQVDADLGRIERDVKLTDGKETPETIALKLGRVNAAIKRAQTVVDPRFGGTMQQLEVAEYDRLLDARQKLEEQRDAKKKAAKQTDYQRQLTAMYGTVTGTATAEENAGERLRDQIQDDTNLTADEKASFGVDKDGRVIAGSQLDRIITLSDLKGKTRQTDTQFDTDRELALQAAGDDAYLFDREGFAARAKAEYDAASRAFDSKKGTFPDLASFEAAKASALSGLLQNVKQSADDVRAWNKSLKASRKEITRLGASFGGVDSTGRYTTQVEDQIDKDKDRFAPDSPEMKELTRMLGAAKLYDRLDLRARKTKNAFEVDDQLNVDSRYRIDYAGRVRVAQKQYDDAVAEFNAPENLAKLGIKSEAQRKTLEAAATAGQRENLTQAKGNLMSREQRDRAFRGSMNRLDSGFGLLDATRSNTDAALAERDSVAVEYGKGSREYAEVMAKLPSAKVFDGLALSAKVFAQRIQTSDDSNFDTRYKINFTARRQAAEQELATDTGRFNNPAYLQQLRDQGKTAKEIEQMRNAALKGARDNVIKARSDELAWNNKQFGIDESVRGLREQTGLESLASDRVKAVDRLVRDLEQDPTDIAKDDPRFAELARIRVIAQQMDTADDNLRLGKQASSYAGLNDGTVAYQLDAAAQQAWIKANTAVAATNKQVRDSIDSMNLAMSQQNQAMRDSARIMKNEYAAAARDAALSTERLAAAAEAAGRLGTTQGFVDTQRLNVQAADNQVTNFTQGREARLAEFKRTAYDLGGLLQLLPEDQRGRWESQMVATTDAAGKTVYSMADAGEQDALVEAAFAVRDENERVGVVNNAAQARVDVGSATLDRLGQLAPEQGFETLVGQLLDPKNRRTPEELVKETLGDVQGTLDFARENVNVKSLLSSERGRRVEGDAQAFANQLAALKPEDLARLTELRDAQTALTRNETAAALITGDSPTDVAERAALQAARNEISTRVQAAAGALKDVLPQDTIDKLLAGSLFLDDQAERLRALADIKRDALARALTDESRDEYARASKSRVSPEATSRYYDTLIGDKRAELDTAYADVRAVPLANINSRFAELAKANKMELGTAEQAQALYTKTGDAELGRALLALKDLPDAARLTAMSTAELSKVLNPEQFAAVTALRREGSALKDEKGEALATVSETLFDMGTRLGDALRDSASIRLDRSLAARDYAGAGRNAALVSGQLEDRLLASYNAGTGNSKTRADLPALLESLASDANYAGQVAEIVGTRRELAQRIDSAATMDGYSESLSRYDRDVARARPQFSERGGQAYDLRMLRGKLAFQQGIDTSALDPSSQKQVLDDVRATMREIEDLSLKMQDRWRDFWNGLAGDMMNALKDGLSKTVTSLLDRMFDIESEAAKQRRISNATSGMEEQGLLDQAAAERANAAEFTRLANEAEAAGRFQEAAGLRQNATTSRDNAAQLENAARGKQTDRAITDYQFEQGEGNEMSNIWAGAVDNMKQAFVSRVTGDMLDESVGALLDQLTNRLTGTEDPQLVAAEKIAGAGDRLNEVVTALPTAITDAFANVGTTQQSAADRMMDAANLMVTAASGMGGGGGGGGAVPADTGSYGVKYGHYGTGSAAPENFGVSYANNGGGAPEAPGHYGPSMSERYNTYGPSAPSAPAPSAPKADLPQPLLKNADSRAMAGAGFNMIANAVPMPKTGSALGDYGIGYVKNTVIAGVGSWIAAGAAGGMAGAGAAIGAAFTNPVTAAIAVVGAGIMLMQRNMANQKQVRDFNNNHAYNMKSNGAYDYGLPKNRWVQVGGERVGQGTAIANVNINMQEPLSSASSQLEIGRRIAQQTRVEGLRRGVNG